MSTTTTTTVRRTPIQVAQGKVDAAQKSAAKALTAELKHKEAIAKAKAKLDALEAKTVQVYERSNAAERKLQEANDLLLLRRTQEAERVAKAEEAALVKAEREEAKARKQAEQEAKVAAKVERQVKAKAYGTIITNVKGIQLPTLITSEALAELLHDTFGRTRKGFLDANTSIALVELCNDEGIWIECGSEILLKGRTTKYILTFVDDGGISYLSAKV